MPTKKALAPACFPASLLTLVASYAMTKSSTKHAANIALPSPELTPTADVNPACTQLFNV